MAKPPATGPAFRAGARFRAIPDTATSPTCSPRRVTSPSPSPRTASMARTACSRTAARPRARELVRHHLAQWAEWSAHGGDPWGGPLQGPREPRRARAGRPQPRRGGVERAAIDTYPDDPWQVQGLVLIGPDGVRPPGRAGRAHDRHPAVLRRRRVRPAGPAVRRRRARPDARPRAAVLRHGDGHQPQLLQHRVDTGPCRSRRRGTTGSTPAIRSAARTAAAASRRPNSRRSGSPIPRRSSISPSPATRARCPCSTARA